MVVIVFGISFVLGLRIDWRRGFGTFEDLFHGFCIFFISEMKNTILTPIRKEKQIRRFSCLIRRGQKFRNYMVGMVVYVTWRRGLEKNGWRKGFVSVASFLPRELNWLIQ